MKKFFYDNIVAVCAISVLAITILTALYHTLLGCIRLDQYAITICSCIIGVIVTMFGLTSASYAFLCGDLRVESQENLHIQKVLLEYKKRLWVLFCYSIIGAAFVLFVTLVSFFIIQKSMDTTLYKMTTDITSISEWVSFAFYENKNYHTISDIVFIDLITSSLAFFIMILMNYNIFRREKAYYTIAKDLIDKIDNKYQFDNFYNKKNAKYEDYNKIHNIEILINRILKNHENLGEAYSEKQRRESLLTVIVSKTIGEYRNKSNINSWDNLNNSKKNNRHESCSEIAERDYEFIEKNELHDGKGLTSPTMCNFIMVYEDLVTYRDSRLVKESNAIESGQTSNCSHGHELRCTVKKRLLMFYLKGENFSDMDLSQMSLSGADLRYANFSNCNLSRVRLKGANCEGADFSRTKLTGMYFADSNYKGEIELSCLDDGSDSWDMYKGKEITNFKGATFYEADVSRAQLVFPGAVTDNNFPFFNSELETNPTNSLFSMQGTNFDHAKMYNSLYKSIDLSDASLNSAQIYNAALLQLIAKNTNFSGSILTHACIALCDFENANFENAYLMNSYIFRSKYTGAKLTNANFSFSNIISCNFDGSNCQNVSFRNIVQNYIIDSLKRYDINLDPKGNLSFQHAVLTGTDFSGANLSNAKFNNAIGKDCVFTKGTGENVSFKHAILTSSILDSTELKKCDFTHAILRDSILNDTRFKQCIFQDTDFSNSLFSVGKSPCFDGGKMSSVKFTNSNGLNAACFKNIHLNRVDFCGTGITKCDFKKCKNVTLSNCRF